MARKKHYWQNEDESLIKHILKQFKCPSAPNMSIYTRLHTCRLSDVGWLLSFFYRVYD